MSEAALVLLLAALVCWRVARAAVRAVLTVAALAIAVALIGACQNDANPRGNARSGELTRWVDGDTAHVSVNGHQETIRLLGISAPETTHGTLECGGADATAYMRRLAAAGTSVRVTTDAASGDITDAYGRTLAYLDTRGGDVGEALIRGGYATVYRYRGRRLSRLERYQDAQRSARSTSSGAWRHCRRFADRG